VGPLLSYKFNYLYTKIPLSVFKIKIEVIKGDKIFVYNIHLVVLLACKSNALIKKDKLFTINSINPVDFLYYHLILMDLNMPFLQNLFNAL